MGFTMDIKWGLFMITTCWLYVSHTSARQTYHFTEGENATIHFLQELDKPLEAYSWSLQFSNKEHPFYFHVGGDTDGTFHSNMLSSLDQRDRLTVSSEMKHSVLSVNILFVLINVHDNGIILLTVLDKIHEEPLLVLETSIWIVPINQVHEDRYCSLGYTAPQVKGWRWINFSSTAKKGAIFQCYALYPINGKLLIDITFVKNSRYNAGLPVEINSRYYCCLEYVNKFRCEYYELESSFNLKLTNVTSQAPSLGILHILPAAINTVARDLIVELSIPLAISMLANIVIVIYFIWVYCIRPRTRRRNNPNSSDNSAEQSELDEYSETNELRRRPQALVSNQN